VGAYVMVGMYAAVAGATPATLQTTVMAPEMTKNYEMTLRRLFSALFEFS